MTEWLFSLTFVVCVTLLYGAALMALIALAFVSPCAFACVAGLAAGFLFGCMWSERDED